MIRALAIILGPILCGAVYLGLAGPPLTPGVYLDMRGGSYWLPTCTDSTPSSTAVGIGRSAVRGFVIVGTDHDTNPVKADLSQLFLRVVDHAAPADDFGRTRIAATVQRVNERVVRVEPTERLQWDETGATGAVYEQAVAGRAGNRSAMELIAELDMPVSNGAPCRYAVVLGPQPPFTDGPARSLLAAPEGRR